MGDELLLRIFLTDYRDGVIELALSEIHLVIIYRSVILCFCVFILY